LPTHPPYSYTYHECIVEPRSSGRHRHFTSCRLTGRSSSSSSSELHATGYFERADKGVQIKRHIKRTIKAKDLWHDVALTSTDQEAERLISTLRTDVQQSQILRIPSRAILIRIYRAALTGDVNARLLHRETSDVVGLMPHTYITWLSIVSHLYLAVNLAVAAKHTVGCLTPVV
jgi:hypothetical protein